MAAEPERFAVDDDPQVTQAHRGTQHAVIIHLQAQDLVYQPKRSLGKLSKDDKKTILNTIETMDWIEEHGSDASTEDPEEKLAGN